MKNKKEAKFCPDCGSKLEVKKVPNEEDFFTTYYWSMGRSVNRAGEKYDRATGKKMYRTEYHCPTTKTKGFFCKRTFSHYIILGETDLVE